ncbi:hypothetical protein [Synechocystis sp. PCC 7509]|uniref:hypothetical protein n=1 Tax=Synechocystis sp. PCC 7509 TaxID=927677 RepID=UPI0002ABA6E2|nr:hypothetical protein [Synechocystis sp. PCC 7509]
MKEINPNDFASRGWELDPMFPPGFFYPLKEGTPHLHLTSVLDSGKPVMAYLGYKDASGTKVIFQGGQWNQSIVDQIPDAKIKIEANFAKAYS